VRKCLFFVAKLSLSIRNNNLRGIAAMLVAVVLFALMDSVMKLLAAHYPPLQIAALRGLSSLPLVCAWVIWRRALPSLLRVRWPLHLLRGALAILMLSLFVFALRSLPLAEAYTIFFISPLLITAMSALILKEKITAARWYAIAGGMLGVLVVLRPGGDGLLSLAALAVLASASCYAMLAITVRVLSPTDSGESMVFWLTLALGIGAGLFAAPGWVSFNTAHLPLLATLAVTGFLGQVLVTEAFRNSEGSAVAPFEYTALAWAAGMDWLVWRVLPDHYTLAGAGIIIASGVFLVRSEGKRVRKHI
jgi:drug/metabolite transporter (DMT)-like permease